MIRLTFTPDVVSQSDLAPGNLAVAMRQLHAHVPIVELFVDLKDALLKKYLYRITALDGRLWKQFLYMTDPVGLTFDVADIWSEHEFVPHRGVRATVVAILQSYPSLTQIKYEVL
jgi:hypothetical protein